MSPIRTAVVGVGHLGYHHARLYKSIEHTQLVGFVDPDDGRAQAVATDFGIPRFDSLAALIEAGVDAVSVAAPTSVHSTIALPLLEAGVDVLVEKPMATTMVEARVMVDAAHANRRVLQVGHVERFNGAVIALFDAIQNPRFIECHRLSPYPNRGEDVSVVYDLMIHDLDIVLALVQSDIASIDAVGVPVFSKHEDIANARIRFASGCVANLTSSRVSVEKMRKIRIFESDAYMSTDYSEQEVMRYRKKPGPMTGAAMPMDMIAIDTLPVVRGEPLRRELEAFLECVRQRTAPIVDGQHGLRALQAAEDIVRFIRNHPGQD
jgi:predicted dehydrogenase